MRRRWLVALGMGLVAGARAGSAAADDSLTPLPAPPPEADVTPAPAPSSAPAAPSSIPVGPSTSVVVDEPRPTRWYGWQTVLADVAVTGLYALAARSDDGTPAAIATLGYFLGAPAIHSAHDQGGRSYASLGLRLVLPVIGVLAGVGIATLADRRDPNREFDFARGAGAILGCLAGMLSASVIDATVLAYEPAGREVGSPPTSSAGPLFPSLGVARDGTRGVAPVVQVGGRF